MLLYGLPYYTQHTIYNRNDKQMGMYREVNNRARKKFFFFLFFFLYMYKDFA